MSGPRTAIAIGVVLAVAATGAAAADLARGAEVYQRHCAVCHGASGASTWPGAPNLSRREGLLQTDFALLRSLRTGRGAMPGYQGMLSDLDLLNVIAFSRSLTR